ncbi:diguanylate cyclase domain-containing protein [Vibrio genomosp. F10]|uniref:diguanylate cyclase domain-containing protein n=1 Tax=Vibrio genomosp. F10 TaxID=723171 RepID=UPI00031046F4|nr:diguanylate cyclase [Vibrio genomosp. F10]OEF05370.1 hypothetical protein A1QI_08390 [Vibrio genomosp. F10 str. 9ZB36]
MVNKIKPRSLILLTAVYLLISHSLISFITGIFVDKQMQLGREDVQHELDLVRYSIEANVYRDTYLADSFASVIALDPQFAMNNWSFVSEQFLSKANLVRNIGLAPNDIISHVYPLEGNEKAIGLDFRTVPNQYRSVQLAKQQKKVFVAGPLELVQGGVALIARYPIFTDIPQNNEYWGGLSVVIDYDKLIAQSALSTLKGATIALTGHNNQLIEGDEKVLANYDASYPIYMPNGNWNLFAKYTGFEQIDSIQRFNVLFRALGWATFSVIYILVLFLIRNYIRVQKLSLHDELTKLPNRRFLFHELNKVMSRNDNTVHFTILNMDLDKFKDINDSLGHEAGDAVLKYIASLLTHSLRSTDFVSRVGGDEFIVILQRLTIPNDVQKVIEKININVKQNAFQWKGQETPLSLSIGYCSYSGNPDPTVINDLLSKADKNMYKEKRNDKST